MSETPRTETGPAALIKSDGRSLLMIAAAAGVSIDTVQKAKATGQWPAQHRTRTSLMRALGVMPRESADQNPPQVQA